MRMKSLTVIALLILGCSFASAQTFGFMSVGGGLYCNYEQLTRLAPYDVWQGVDNLSVCGVPNNATIVGVNGGLSKAGDPIDIPVKGVLYADNIYNAYFGTLTTAQWFAATNLKCSTKRYGWVAFASASAQIFGYNYGYLSCTLPTSYGKGPSACPACPPGYGKGPSAYGQHDPTIGQPKVK